MPESVTAITVDGRPVVVCQAVSTLFPSTPQSSWGLSESVGSLERALVSFTSPPPWLQLAGRSGMAGGRRVRDRPPMRHSSCRAGAAGQGNCPVWVAVPDPVLGSLVSGGHDAGRSSTTAWRVGSVAWGSPVFDGAAAALTADHGATPSSPALDTTVRAIATSGVIGRKHARRRPSAAIGRVERGRPTRDRSERNGPPRVVGV